MLERLFRDMDVREIAGATEGGDASLLGAAALFDQLSEGVIVADRDGRLVLVNEAAARLHGVRRLDVAPEDYSDTYHLLTEAGKPYPPERLPLTRAVRHGEIVTDARWRIRRPDGSEVLAIGSARPLRDPQGRQFGAVLTFRDDTARHQAERDLAESEARFRAMADSAPAPVWVTNEGGIEFANRAFEEFAGLPVDELRGETWTKIIHPEDLPAIWAMRAAAWEKREPYEFEARFRNAAGEWLWMRTSSRPRFDAEGALLGYVGMAVDVTETRRAEAELREESRTLETINRTGEAVAAELDLETVVGMVTDAGVELTGAQFGAFFYNVIDRSGESYMLYALSGVDRSAFETYPMPRNTAVFGPTFRGEGVVRSDDIMADPRYGRSEPYRGMPPGHLPVRSYLAVPVISRSGEVIGGLFFGHPETGRFDERHERLMAGLAAQAAVAIDNARLYQEAQREIEERRRAEGTLRESEERLGRALDAAGMGAWELDLATGDAWRSLLHDRIFGYEALLPEWSYESFLEHVLPDDRAEVDRSFQDAIASRSGWAFECRIRRADGIVRWIWAQGKVELDAGNQPLRMKGLVWDITDRKTVEEALRDRAEEMQTILDAVPAAIWIARDPEAREVVGNRASYELLRLDEGVNASLSAAEDERPSGFKVYAEGRELEPEELPVQRAAKGELVERFEEEVRFEDGTSVSLYGNAVPLHDSAGRVRGGVAAFVDVTQRRQAEERYRQIVEGAEDFAIVTLDEAGTITSWNSGAERMTGYTEEEALGQPGAIFFSPEDREAGAPDHEMNRAKSDGRAINERWHQRKDGSRFWGSGLMMRLDVPGGGYLKIFRDRTAEHEAEATMRENERRLRAAVLASPFPMMLHAEDGQVLELSRKWTELTGYDRAELKTHFDWFRLAYPGRDGDLAKLLTEEFGREGEIAAGEFEIRVKDGSTRIWDFHNVGLGKLPDGRRLQISAASDVTERRAAEEALRESEGRFRALAGSVPAFVWFASADGALHYLNERWCEYTGQTPAEALPHGWADALHPDDAERTARLWQDAIGKGVNYEAECRYRRHDGAYRWYMARAEPLRDGSGAVTGWFGTSSDIHEQKQYQQHLRLLVDELNHRVKNTLAIVQSLAHQTFRSEGVSGEARGAFEGRLEALAAAHNLLTRENWEAAALRDVVDAALHAHDRKDGRFSIDGPPVRLEPKTAVTIAMALHELATNALKYGALSNARGQVSIGWRVSEGPEPRLTMRWEEHGGPPVAQPVHRGFGSRMIERALASDLRGTVLLDFRPEGLVCEIDAPLPRPGQVP